MEIQLSKGKAIVQHQSLGATNHQELISSIQIEKADHQQQQQSLFKSPKHNLQLKNNNQATVQASDLFNARRVDNGAPAHVVMLPDLNSMSVPQSVRNSNEYSVGKGQVHYLTARKISQQPIAPQLISIQEQQLVKNKRRGGQHQQHQLPQISHLQATFQQSQSQLIRPLVSPAIDDQWHSLPRFNIQTKALFDNQFNQYSLQTLQRIRAHALLSQNAAAINNGIQQTITNQFQPFSPLVKADAQNCKANGLRTQRTSLQLPEQSQMLQYPQKTSKKRKMSEANAAGNVSRYNSKGHSTNLDKTDHNTKRKSKKKQKEQIKTIAKTEAENDQLNITSREEMEIDDDGNGISGQTFVPSKSQMHTPLSTCTGLETAHIRSAANLDVSSITPTKQRKDDGAATNTNRQQKTKQAGKKQVGERHQRQFSQAQRQNRNSLVGNTKSGRQVNTSKVEQGGNNIRAITMNSPLMQPPPQILQSKIIIHLLKTEYPLIEQVARQDLNWRVTKSENPNAEFDVYWNDIGIDSDKLSSLKPYQKTNHFPAMYQITRKAFLAKNLKRLQKLYPLEFDFFPRTWVFPNEINELRNFAAYKPKKMKSPLKKSSKTANLSQHFSPAINALMEGKPVPQEPKRTTATRLDISIIKETSRERTAPLSSHDEIARNGFIKLTQSNPTTVPNTASGKPTTVAVAIDKVDTEESGAEDENESEEEEDVSEAPTPRPAPVAPPQQQVLSPSKRSPMMKEQRKAPIPRMSNCNKKTKFPMIVKPDCSSQGKGIFLTNDIDSIPKDEIYVVQQYMQNPYLLDGLKFDLRLYVLVLSCEPLKIFLYEEGLVRFATHKFEPLEINSDKSAFNNFFMHLTNYAINKESDQFRAAKSINDDTGHKRTLKKVLERLKQDGQDTDRIMGEIKDVIIKTMVTIQQDLAHNYRTCQPADLENLMCFEILGFDIILDDTGKPILLEVNQAPSFATDSPLDYDIKRGLFQDTFRLLGLSVEKKKQKLRRLYEEKKDRMLTKLTLKQKNQQRRTAIKENKIEQEQFELKNNGRFEQIYPLPVNQAAESNQASQNDLSLTQSQKQLAQSQYQALHRQQERYNQLLATLSNTEIEKAIRAKNRQDDQNKKEEKEGKSQKLRQKKTEKKKNDAIESKRNESHLKKTVTQMNEAAAVAATQATHLRVLIRPEEQIEFAMRNSVIKPPGTLLVQQSHSDSINRPTNSGNPAHQHHPHAYHRMDQAAQESTTLRVKHTNNHARQSKIRESINLDQNLKQFIDIQQKIGLSSPIIFPQHNTPQSTIFKKYRLGGGLQQTNASTPAVETRKSPLNGSSVMIQPISPQGAVEGGALMYDGMKPNVMQLQYNTTAATLAQSQNPIYLGGTNLRESSGVKMNQTQGQSNRQGNLLPNIARNMIPAEKSATGFTTAQNSQQNSSLLQQQQQKAQQQLNEQQYLRGRQTKHRERLRGSIDTQSSVSQHQKVAVELNASNSKSASKQLRTSNGQSPNMNSPKRGVVLKDRSNHQRTSIQSISQQKPLHLKTQQMNLGSMNIQPVIIDSNHFNQSSEQQPKKSPLNIGGSGYKTQKFSKIQLQTIIDNLQQYEQPNTGGSATKNVMSPASIKSPMHHHLPDFLMSADSSNVNQKEALAKQYNNVADLALNAIAAARVNKVQQPGSSPRNNRTPGRRLASSESKQQQQNVINFNNCNVTIINNNFEGSMTQQLGSTIIQRSLNARPVGSSQTAKKVGQGQAAGGGYLQRINEVARDRNNNHNQGGDQN